MLAQQHSRPLVGACRSVSRSTPVPFLSRPALGRSMRENPAHQGTGPSTVARASTEPGKDFDAILSKIADKFEKSDNKPVIIGYSAAALAAFFFSEWLISRPLLNILLGWPIQLLGLVMLPYFGVKYFVEGDSITGDASDAFDKVVKKLPGFEE